jgi:hypothetical protein
LAHDHQGGYPALPVPGTGEGWCSGHVRISESLYTQGEVPQGPLLRDRRGRLLGGIFVTVERETACECGDPAVVRGMCRRCYQRWWHAEHPGRQAEYQRKWWARNRERLNAGRRKPLEPRICPICGETFVPATANQRFCGPTDDDRARQKGQACSRCARRAENARYRARYRPRRRYV